MDVIVVLLSALSLAAWIHLIGFRGAFWRADQRLEPSLPPQPWPGVVAIIPARDEERTVEAAPGRRQGGMASGRPLSPRRHGLTAIYDRRP